VRSVSLLCPAWEFVNCWLYDSQVGVRMEDNLRNLKVRRLGFGSGVAHQYHMVGRREIMWITHCIEDRDGVAQCRLRLRGANFLFHARYLLPGRPAPLPYKIPVC